MMSGMNARIQCLKPRSNNSLVNPPKGSQNPRSPPPPVKGTSPSRHVKFDSPYNRVHPNVSRFQILGYSPTHSCFNFVPSLIRCEKNGIYMQSYSGYDGRGVSGESCADPVEVERVCKVIDELFALDRNMEVVLDECGVRLSHDLVVDVLQRFKHARKPAFRFFC
ncbi:hypothetical protein JHK85_048767 [Glycine max]|nr:hypothetical protein JHK85_048767 [Glycine max]